MSRRVTRRCNRPSRGNERPHKPLEPDTSCQLKSWRTFGVGPVVGGLQSRTLAAHDSARGRSAMPEAPFGTMRRRGRPSGLAVESARPRYVDSESRESRPSCESRPGCDRTQERHRLRCDFFLAPSGSLELIGAGPETTCQQSAASGGVCEQAIACSCPSGD